MASKRRQRRNQCGNKRRYATFEEARANMLRMNRQTKEYGMTPYRCSFCGQYHYGHTPARIKQAIRASKKGF